MSAHGPTHPASRLLAQAGPTCSMPEAATALGIGKDTIYDLHARGALGDMGIRVLRLGRRLRVVTADLRRAVGEPHDDGPAAA